MTTNKYGIVNHVSRQNTCHNGMNDNNENNNNNNNNNNVIIIIIIDN